MLLPRKIKIVLLLCALYMCITAMVMWKQQVRIWDLQLRQVVKRTDSEVDCTQSKLTKKLSVPNVVTITKLQEHNETAVKSVLSWTSTHSTQLQDFHAKLKIADWYKPLKLPSPSDIPHILHQTYINEHIPPTYEEHVRSWKGHKPPLRHVFWSNADSDRFVADHYPHFIKKFRSYGHDLSRADSIRYMLLHFYGGVYADMDVRLLRSMQSLLTKYKCIMSQERYEQTQLYWGRKKCMMNAVMLSVPGHLFLDYVVQQLPIYHKRTPDVMSSTGPFFLQEVYDNYEKKPPCDMNNPYCSCYIADPYLFLPQIDPIRISLFQGKCSNEYNRMKDFQKQACHTMIKMNWQNDIDFVSKKAYTLHAFLHYGFSNGKQTFPRTVNIKDIVKNVSLYKINFQ